MFVFQNVITALFQCSKYQGDQRYCPCPKYRTENGKTTHLEVEIVRVENSNPWEHRFLDSVIKLMSSLFTRGKVSMSSLVMIIQLTDYCTLHSKDN